MGKIATEYLITEPWRIVERGFHADRNRVSESVFSVANEYCGARGYMEESEAADSLRGCYFNGVYEWAEKENETAYKGIIRRGHYMVNGADFLKCRLFVDGVRIDPVSASVSDFERSLDMRSGLFTRKYAFHTPNGAIRLTFERFLDMTECERAYQKIVADADFEGEITCELILSFDTRHWGKAGRWTVEERTRGNNFSALKASTASTSQYLASAQYIDAPEYADVSSSYSGKEECVTVKFRRAGRTEIIRYVANVAVKDGLDAFAAEKALSLAGESFGESFGAALARNKAYWEAFWRDTDIEIEGDERNQQGIRFCIFQLQQTYHGQNPKNNIGAKGLTGEAYSGHAFWDTETYCLPYFLFNNPEAAKDLLLFRYHTLPQAKARAAMLDCGGACYPIATLNGEEACDLWQHASLQFQPSTGVAYGIRHYVNVTGDTGFLAACGLEMLLEISRFLMDRGDFNADRTRFGFYCVMGPDEFQMMVNHNCYTNYMAKKTFEYTLEAADFVKKTDPKAYSSLLKRLKFTAEEFDLMRECAEKAYILYDDKTLLFEQHQNYYDLPHVDVKSIPVEDFPLYGHWSYDRIYRNDMIKQPDVLMFLLLCNGDFTCEQKKANYEFYEPRCIHESSLSPSVHSVLAAELGKEREAVDFFAFATRMDLDDYNRNTAEGLHTTSIAAAWLNIVYGFGGLRSDGDALILNPVIPSGWQSYSFRITYRGVKLKITVEHGKTTSETEEGKTAEIILYGERRVLGGLTVTAT